MVAQGGGIIPGSIHKLNGGFSLAEIHQIVILNGISCIQKQYLIAVGLKLLLEAGYYSHAVVAVSVFVIAVGIVGMQDNQLAEIGCQG